MKLQEKMEKYQGKISEFLKLENTWSSYHILKKYATINIYLKKIYTYKRKFL